MNPNREEALFALALEKPAEKRSSFLDAECEGDAALRQRLDAMMNHPNIAKVLDAGTTETGRPYFVMELVRGIRITGWHRNNQRTDAPS